MKVLLTGANGRLGMQVQRALAARPDTEIIRAVGPHASRRLADDVVLDLADAKNIERVVRDAQPDAIIHLGAMVGASCEADPVLARRINVTATTQLARVGIVSGMTHFAFASTSAVYGDQGVSPAAESDPVHAGSEYARTKAGAEEELGRLASENVTFTGAALRIFNIYGPGFDDSLVNRLRTSTPDAPVPLRGLDGFMRDYVHAEDVVGALIAATGRTTGKDFLVVNIGSGEPVSNRELVRRIGEVRKPSVTIGAESRSYSCADISLARRELGFSPRLLTADAVRDL